ncbi:MAG TPA: PaaX family transcriptional regulator C-terminal domain-containing protein [Nocardioidaceae bacterium]|nr:PaaX family transcriptional regulator C-terminal domain-containing protein [Nocardioidaceae bacterium]
MAEPAPRQLILTLYGLYARDEHSWLSVGSVVRLLGDLGVDAAGVRSSISRLKRRGVLTALRLDQVAGYALSESALELLQEGDRRIFTRPRASEAHGFVQVVFSVPEAERDKRHTLRRALAGMGFGTVSAGVWVAPAWRHEEATHALQRLGLDRYVDLFHVRHDGFAPLRERVAQWWDLDAIDREYADLVRRYADAHRRWKDSGSAVRTAFEIYVPMLTEWRRLPYLDPGLPASLLPDGWHGRRAADLFADLDALLRTPAREHALATIHG